jgi:hypothetical protein
MISSEINAPRNELEAVTMYERIIASGFAKTNLYASKLIFCGNIE